MGESEGVEGGVGYFMWSITENRLIMDEVTSEYHGFSAEVGAQGVTIEDILERIDIEMRDRVASAIIDSITEKALFDQRYKVIRPDGTTRIIAARARPIFDADDAPFLGLGAVHEVTFKRPRLLGGT